MMKLIRSTLSLLLIFLLASLIVYVSIFGACSTSKTYLLGDVNRNGIVNISDATDVQCDIAKMLTLDEEQIYLANVDGMAGVNIKDATFIQMYIAKFVTDFPTNDDGYKIGDEVSFNNEYTVVFKDYDGEIIKTESVLAGESATAPETPIRDGYVFVKWDKSFDNVTSNLEITAIYEQNLTTTYTVVFKDYDGTIIKTESVLAGTSAIPPENPIRDGYDFIGWDKSYDDVLGNIEITAIYEQKSTTDYTVTFKDYDGTVLSNQTVSKGGTAILPDAPTKKDQTFLGWTGNYANINKNETVKAVYSDQTNVFIVESTPVAEDDTVTVLVSIDGVVKTCGFDFTILYDCGLELVSFDSDLDLDIVANEKAVENGIVLNFSSASDKTKQRDIMELTFKIKDASKTDFPVTINVKSVKEVSGSNIINADYIIVNGLVKKK